MVRFGIGYDAHCLVEGQPLILAGIRIPHNSGLAGHSDGDVACHAIADALLGAASLGDLGTHFKPSDPAVPAGVSSLGLLETTGKLLKKNGWKVGNVDATIVAQQPRLEGHVLAMRRAVAQALDVSYDLVSIKATTTDGMGFTGTGQGIAAYAVTSLVVLSSD